jgi:molybdopterin-guanine dinucleotide biosynthesis protein A
MPGDAPFLPRDLVARLLAARAAAGSTIACAASGGQVHPVAGLWPVALHDDLRQAMDEQGLRKVTDFTARHALATADFAVAPIDPFLNVNTPDDLEQATRLLAVAP